MIMKHKDHDHIITKFDEAKQKQLERLATKLLKRDEKVRKLREKRSDHGFLKFFEDGD